jgi:hypothetical protein
MEVESESSPRTGNKEATIQGRRPQPPINPEKYGAKSLRHKTQETSQEQQSKRSLGGDHEQAAQARHSGGKKIRKLIGAAVTPSKLVYN